MKQTYIPRSPTLSKRDTADWYAREARTAGEFRRLEDRLAAAKRDQYLAYAVGFLAGTLATWLLLG